MTKATKILNIIYSVTVVLFLLDNMPSFDIKSQAIKSFVYFGLLIGTPLTLIWNLLVIKTKKSKIIWVVIPIIILIVILIVGPIKILFSTGAWQTQTILYQNGHFQTEMLQDGSVNPDRAYPILLNLLPVGLKGLSFAALTAAIVASLAGKANSIATIFTLDVYKEKINVEASEKKLVNIGKLTIISAMIIAVVVAPFLGIDKKGGFQYIQEYTGFVSPGVFAMFILGFFWKKTTSNAALFATIGGFILSIIFKFMPAFVDLSFLNPIGFAVLNADGVYEIPFLDRMGFSFILVSLIMIIISLRENKNDDPKAIYFDTNYFKTSTAFNLMAMTVIGIVAAIYIVFW